MKKLLLLLLCLSVFSVCSVGTLHADEPETPAVVQIEPHIVATPAAAHPQALVKAINPHELTVCFDWLDANGNPVDSGNSIAAYTTADPEAPPTDAELIAAITTVAPGAP